MSPYSEGLTSIVLPLGLIVITLLVVLLFNLILSTTCNFSRGVAVPIPILVPLS